MTPERWQQLKQIFQSALERNPAERSAFLSQACGGDPALRSEVESLISSHDQAGDSIEAMAAEAATEMLSADQTGSIAGKQIGRYQALSLIGRGGMGEVFLAQDASLGRKVALKLLRAEFTGDEGRLRRFRQEARAASALNHPNIVTIYEIGEAEVGRFIIMELLKGEPCGPASIIEVEKPWTEQSPQLLSSMGDLVAWGPWSWSPDGRKLAGNKLRGVPAGGILVYSLETQHYERLTDFGRSPVWLSDGQRLLFQHQGKLYLIDSQSKRFASFSRWPRMSSALELRSLVTTARSILVSSPPKQTSG